ncbi:hypothetical protein BpHYR1_031169 [Brachionus plicatilis]|uniref:Uncharacterized protein n=1 Tax=Brachionus plicatilis TaxID=10195 RepID=A0A3M7RT66_BRAPC|nr:hypothetical protein BpHYR1_031169 [Brachionus plicatilis]
MEPAHRQYQQFRRWTKCILKFFNSLKKNVCEKLLKYLAIFDGCRKKNSDSFKNVYYIYLLYLIFDDKLQIFMDIQ